MNNKTHNTTPNSFGSNQVLKSKGHQQSYQINHQSTENQGIANTNQET